MGPVDNQRSTSAKIDIIAVEAKQYLAMRLNGVGYSRPFVSLSQTQKTVISTAAMPSTIAARCHTLFSCPYQLSFSPLRSAPSGRTAYCSQH